MFESILHNKTEFNKFVFILFCLPDNFFIKVQCFLLLPFLKSKYRQTIVCYVDSIVRKIFACLYFLLFCRHFESFVRNKNQLDLIKVSILLQIFELVLLKNKIKTRINNVFLLLFTFHFGLEYENKIAFYLYVAFKHLNMMLKTLQNVDCFCIFLFYLESNRPSSSYYLLYMFVFFVVWCARAPVLILGAKQNATKIWISMCTFKTRR